MTYEDNWWLRSGDDEFWSIVDFATAFPEQTSGQ
ncbi:hypothetical protein EV701_107292 [Chthoniobacter flavus]|nr:hypothetical protein EV701_107292 [Chthoniobacter flavus]